MLYALSRAEIARVRAGFLPQLVGAEMLWAAYRTDPGVVARLLPRPLRPAADPLVVVFVASYPQTNFGSVYHEAALFVTAALRGRRGGYCLAMPVDDDSALVSGRELYGFPKKLGRVSLDRRGAAVVGRAERRGAEILRVDAELEGPARPGDLDPFGEAASDQGRPCRRVRSFNFKCSPRSDGKRFDFLPRLVEQVTLLRPRPGLRRGTARVTVASTPYDPLGELPVLEQPFACVYGVFDNTMLPGKGVARAWNLLRFLPHAFFKLDVVPVVLGQAGREGRGAAAGPGGDDRRTF